ncbi:MAG: hypothetical protein QXL94_00415 [Candidatus Parvarchaeum sp.]
MADLSAAFSSSKVNQIHTWGGLVATVGFITASGVAGYETHGGIGALAGALIATAIMAVTDAVIIAS